MIYHVELNVNEIFVQSSGDDWIIYRFAPFGLLIKSFCVFCLSLCCVKSILRSLFESKLSSHDLLKQIKEF